LTRSGTEDHSSRPAQSKKKISQTHLKEQARGVAQEALSSNLSATKILLFVLVGLGFVFAEQAVYQPHCQSILLWLFWRWGSQELFAQAGLKP
jgi:hypothetical protein